jgi:hypothetical protein
MRRWVLLSRYHWTALLLLMGVCASVVAWISVDLIRLTMANFEFLGRFGLQAIREGGLLQLLGIGARAALGLLVYLVFKATEAELIDRWRSAGK